MQVGIIGGTGAQGRALAARLGAIGIATLVGSRDRERAHTAVETLREARGDLPLEAASNEHVAERGDVIFLTVPFADAAAAVRTLGPRFQSGTILVDVTVPLAFTGGVPGVIEVAEGSATEQIRAWAPSGIRVASALKTIPASSLGKVDTPLDCDDFVCGDTREARDTVIALLGKIPGLRPLDAGGLESARAIERMTALAIVLNKRYKVRAGRFKVVGV